MTQEEQKAIETLKTLAQMLQPKTTSTDVAHSHIIAARDYAVKSVSELNQALAILAPAGDIMPAVEPTNRDKPVKNSIIIPPPASVDTEVQTEKASKWGKFKSVFKKVWPVAAVAAAFIPGAPLVVGAVNAVLSTTADPTTAGVVGGAAGVTALITAGVSEYRKQAAAEKPKK